MGVRESVEQSSDENRLQDFVIEEERPKVELPFDPDTEVTEKDYAAMNRRLEFLHEIERKRDIGSQDAHITACQLALAIEIIQSKGANKWKVHDADRVPTMPQQSGGIYKEAYVLHHGKPLIGDDKSMTWNRVEAHLSEALPHRKYFYRKKAWGMTTWYDFSYEAAMRKLNFRDRAEEFSQLISKDMWDGMGDYLAGLRRTRQEDKTGLKDEMFAILAMRMTILAAEEIKISDEGVKLKMPEKTKKTSYAEKQKPRPERRSF